MNAIHPVYDLLIDSDAFVGWALETDPHHQRATMLFEQAQKSNQRLVTHNFVVAETATVLSHRSGQAVACDFLDAVRKIPQLYVSEDLFLKALSIFRTQENKNTSFVDCLNVIVMKYLSIPRLLSFDQFYRKKFDLKLAA
ncbi:MAG: PIN domain-containing protein [Anaerolineae bacterium]